MEGDNVYITPANGERRCRTCGKIASKKWYTNNKERHKVMRENWVANNRDRLHELQRNWYNKNKELHLERSKRWSADNLDLKALYRRQRRAKIKKAKGFATLEQLQARIAYFGFQCSYCPGPYEELDHAIPLDRGGTNWPSNIRPSCQPCNRKKHTKTVWEYLKRIECD